MPLVTLLTDFGLADTYVGQMKGVLQALAPSVTIVDLTHAVPPQDVQAGAFLLWSAVEAFPRGTVHVAVVDPGVGSARLAVAAQARRGDYFVGPDNGLLAPALDRLGGCAAAVKLSNHTYWRAQPSSTFHGRDIFAPVAAYIATGVPVSAFGPSVQLQRPFELTFADGRRGEVIHIDTYGNLITNFPAERLPPRFEVRFGDHRVKLVPFYAAAQPGELIALVGSSGLLELAVRDGSAAAVAGAQRGDAVELIGS
jgi:S-adenosyl-L-methionine hydrolase (adenosine-forming)